MPNLIHVTKLNELTERKDKFRKPLPFQFKYIKKSTGEIIEVDEAIVTSSYNANRTRNVQILASGEIRKLRDLCFIEYNNTEVYV